MLTVGFIGWRGMVGSVLMNRMQTENDFKKINPIFFSTSTAGGQAPNFGQSNQILQDAYDLNQLAQLDCIITTQGSDYTHQVLAKLRAQGWQGYWIDASSALRMNDDAIIVLDPINQQQINNGLISGVKNYIGGNCTVSLMLLALDGLFKADLVEWVSSMTYQAASGAGANNIRELLAQSGSLYNSIATDLANPQASVLDIAQKVAQQLTSDDFPTQYFGAPLAGSVIPWIDSGLANGQTKEEWKGGAEANKILGYNPNSIKVDGICVRVGVLRSHSQALTIKLKRSDLTLDAIEKLLSNANPWVKFVANNKADSLAKLTPVSVSGSLDIAVGRLKRLNFGDEYISIFTVGDQLLWGAAEPLRRMLNIILEHHVA
jgi:aspartate-semialdehyde dehydrogenase